jgi:hypothetical protein
MKEFPTILHVKHKDRFQEIYYNRLLCYLRKAIYEHVISQDENSYFDLEKFSCLHFKDQKNKEEQVTKLSTIIQSELENLGWTCRVSFGGTALFIYSSDKPPASCWDDGL